MDSEPQQSNISQAETGREEIIEDNLIDLGIVDQGIRLQYQIGDKCVHKVEDEEEDKEQILVEDFAERFSNDYGHFNDSQTTDDVTRNNGLTDQSVEAAVINGNDMMDNNSNGDAVISEELNDCLKEKNLNVNEMTEINRIVNDDSDVNSTSENWTKQEEPATDPLSIRECHVRLKNLRRSARTDRDKSAKSARHGSCSIRVSDTPSSKKIHKQYSLLSAENQDKLEFIMRILSYDLIKLQAAYDLLRCTEPKLPPDQNNSSKEESLYYAKHPIDKSRCKSKKAALISHAEDYSVDDVEASNPESKACNADNTGDEVCTIDIKCNLLDTMDLDADNTSQLDEDRNFIDAEDEDGENFNLNDDIEEELGQESEKKRKRKRKNEDEDDDDDWAKTHQRTRQSKSAAPSVNKPRNAQGGTSMEMKERKKKVKPDDDTSAGKVCHICGKEFLRSYNLQYHLKDIHKRRDVACTYKGCNFITKTKRYLKNHLGVVHKEYDAKKYLCTICGWRGITPSRLVTHMERTHENIRYPCAKCDHKAISLRNLELHVKGVHEKVSFKCDHCDFVSSWEGALRTHMKTRHLNVDKQHKCTKCDLEFSWAALLLQHNQKVHSSIRYPCPECDFHATSVALYNKHMRETHGPNLKIPCDECDKTSRSYSALRCHYRKVHKKSIPPHIKEIRKDKPVNDFPSPIPLDISLPSQ